MLKKLSAAPLAFAQWLGVAGARHRRRCARILMYHGTPRRLAAGLERQLRYLKRLFRLVPLQTLAADPAAGGVALTFDDGLRSNVRVAYPLLARLGIPATFFVCPGLVERNRWLWNHEARQRLFSAPRGLRAELAAEFGVDARVEPFVEWMKSLDLAARKRVERRLREATPGYVPSAQEREEFDVAGWEELRSLDPAIVTIGSHTLNHSILLALPPGALQAEVRESRRMLEERLQRPVELFAYPNGDLNGRVVDCVRAHYRAAVTCVSDWTAPGSDPHLLPRMHAPQGALRLARAMHK